MALSCSATVFALASFSAANDSLSAVSPVTAASNSWIRIFLEANSAWSSSIRWVLATNSWVKDSTAFFNCAELFLLFFSIACNLAICALFSSICFVMNSISDAICCFAVAEFSEIVPRVKSTRLSAAFILRNPSWTSLKVPIISSNSALRWVNSIKRESFSAFRSLLPPPRPLHEANIAAHTNKTTNFFIRLRFTFLNEVIINRLFLQVQSQSRPGVR